MMHLCTALTPIPALELFLSASLIIAILLLTRQERCAHPDAHTVHLVFTGVLAADRQEAVLAHLEQCATCRAHPLPNPRVDFGIAGVWHPDESRLVRRRQEVLATIVGTPGTVMSRSKLVRIPENAGGPLNPY